MFQFTNQICNSYIEFTTWLPRELRTCVSCAFCAGGCFGGTSPAKMAWTSNIGASVFSYQPLGFPRELDSDCIRRYDYIPFFVRLWYVFFKIYPHDRWKSMEKYPPPKQPLSVCRPIPKKEWNRNQFWLVVSTRLKNMSQLGCFFPNIWKNKRCSKPSTSFQWCSYHTAII